jgi:hypothetical protein
LKYPVAVSSRVTCVYFLDTGGVMQQVNHMKRSQAIGPILSLREVSTPVAVLCDEADKDAKLWQRHSVRQYINGVTQVAIKGALYRGDFANARNFAEFFMAPLSFRQRVQRFLISCPDWMLGSSIRCAKWAKGFTQLIRRAP